MNVLEVVQQDIARERLLKPDATVVVGVSGGADSVCLLHVLTRLCAGYRWSLHVAHLNHSLRGPEAEQDMAFVTALALEWGLPYTLETADVNAVAASRHLSLEEAARQVRYGFLARVARQTGASAIAVGHNADDQSETVLMHFLRGTGLAGLRGMLPAVDLDSLYARDGCSSPLTPPVRLVRPLLSVPRSEIEAYCRAHGLSARLDSSNLDTALFRNRLRHELLPLLETYNPNIRTRLRRTAAVAAADYEWLEQEREQAWQRIVHSASEDAVHLDLAGWRALPLALQRATLRHAASRLCAGLRDVEFVHVQQAVEVARDGSTGAVALLPRGLRLTVGYSTLDLAREEWSFTVPPWPLLCEEGPVPVAIPGQTVLPPCRWPAAESAPEGADDLPQWPRWRLEVAPWEGERDFVRANPDRWTAYLDADRLGTRAALRTRQPGDRFQPLHMDGHAAQVAEWMIDAKIPRRWRDHLPLLVHRPGGQGGEEEIAWIVGWRVDERVKVTPETQRIVRLRWVSTLDTKAG